MSEETEEIKIKKNNTITRKIEIWIDATDPEKISEIRKVLWNWDEKCARIANSITRHCAIQMDMNHLAYFNEDFKENNPEIFQQGKGWSPANRTYRIVADTYAGDIPSDIYGSLNRQITSVFQKESKDYFKLNKSVRSYKKGLPIPFSVKNMLNIKLDDQEKNYTFTLFKLPFKTRFGQDRSGNKVIWEKAMGLQADYKFCNSSIQIDGAKIFLLAVFQFTTEKNVFKEGNVMEAHLSLTVPIALIFKGKTFSVGDRKEFLHRRLAIQGSLRRQQIAARYNSGGSGSDITHGTHRVKKIRTVEQFKEYEKNFVLSKHHKYSKKVIDLCLQNKCGELVLKYVHEIDPPEDLSGKEKGKWYEENQPILRNWTYYGLTDKFKYKCKKVGINLIIEKKEVKPT